MSDSMINNRYRVVRELGAGGMGRVFLVEDTNRKNIRLALKTLLQKTRDKAFLDSFMAEFNELAKVSHPNVAAAYDFGLIAKTKEFFFTTEFIPGKELQEVASTASCDKLINLAAQILRGLHFLHEHGLLHNDLKPANILVADREESRKDQARGDLDSLEEKIYGLAGQVKLIDFGLLSRENVAWKNIRGTARYISPERVLCKPADRRSDLYSVGGLLYYLFSGRHLFQAKDSRDLLLKHVREAPRPFTSDKAIPQPVIDLIQKLIEKNPRDRFPSAQAALDFLGDGLGWNEKQGRRSKTPEIAAGKLLFRDRELSVLRESFDAVARGKGAQNILVRGAEGVGKTRLTEEVRTEAQVRGGAFVHLESEVEQRSLQPILDAVSADLRRRGTKVSGGNDTASDGANSDDVAFKLERILLRKAIRMPIVIHFDNFQLASSAVRQFAVELAHNASSIPADSEKCPKLLLIFSCTRREKAVARITGTTTLEVQPLSPEDSAGFLRKVYGQRDIPDAVVKTLCGVAQGNPALLLELSRTLVHEELVRYNGTRWEFPDSLAGVTLPGSLTDSLTERIHVLGEKASATLEWTSIASRPLPARILARCGLIAEKEVDLILQKLVSEGLLTSVEQDREQRFFLAHQGLKTHLVGRLSEDRVEFLHQRLAQGFEEELENVKEGNSREALSEVLANHWRAAGNLPAFLRYAPAAASHLQTGGNLEKALEYHRTIFEHTPEEAAAKKIKSLARLSELHEFLWDLPRSKEYLNQILQVGKGLLKVKDRVSLLRRLAGVEIAGRNPAAAAELLAKARKLANKDNNEALSESLDAPEAWARWFIGDRDVARFLQTRSKQALGDGPATDDPRARQLWIATASHLANLDQHLGHLTHSAKLHTRNLELLEEIDMPQAEAATHASLGSVLLDAGKREAAAEHLRAAIEIGKKIGDRRTLCRARERLGEYNLLYGDLKAALHITQLGLEDAKRLKNLPATANNLRLLGRIYHRAGQTSDSVGVLQRALEILENLKDGLGTLLTRIYLARHFLTDGKALRAQQELVALAKNCEEAGTPLATGLFHLTAVEAALAVGGRSDLGQINAAEEALRAGEYAREACDAPLLRCRVAVLAEDTATARAELEAAGAQLAEFGSTQQQATHKLLEAQIQIAEGDYAAAKATLVALKRWSNQNVLPHVARACDETTREFEAVTA